MKKVLVDTNIWSTILRRSSEEDVIIRKNIELLIGESRLAIIGPIRQEVLSGIKDEKKFHILKNHLSSFEDEIIDSVDYENAAKVFNDCRSKGIAASAIDSLIVAVIQRNGFEIYTKDKDFDEYSKIVKIHKYKERKTA